MFDPHKEAELYKELPTKELKKVLRKYKFLSRSNSDLYNFIFTLMCVFIPYFIFFNVTIFGLTVALLFHYLFFWEYFHQFKKDKLVDDYQKEEIDQVIKILEEYLKDRETKNPSE